MCKPFYGSHYEVNEYLKVADRKLRESIESLECAVADMAFIVALRENSNYDTPTIQGAKFKLIGESLGADEVIETLTLKSFQFKLKPNITGLVTFDKYTCEVKLHNTYEYTNEKGERRGFYIKEEN